MYCKAHYVQLLCLTWIGIPRCACEFLIDLRLAAFRSIGARHTTTANEEKKET